MRRQATAWMVTRLGAPTEALEIQTVEVGEPGVNQVRVAGGGVLPRLQRHRHHPRPLRVAEVRTPLRHRHGGRRHGRGRRARGARRSSADGSSARPRACRAGTRRWPCSRAPSLQLLPKWLSAAEGMAMYFPFLLSYLALRVRGRVGPETWCSSTPRRAAPDPPPSSWPRRSARR